MKETVIMISYLGILVCGSRKEQSVVEGSWRGSEREEQLRDSAPDIIRV
jgi:hypothetical protein